MAVMQGQIQDIPAMSVVGKALVGTSLGSLDPHGTVADAEARTSVVVID